MILAMKTRGRFRTARAAAWAAVGTLIGAAGATLFAAALGALRGGPNQHIALLTALGLSSAVMGAAGALLLAKRC